MTTPPATDADRRCQSCGADRLRTFCEVRDIPVHSVLLLPTREEALAYPRRDLILAFCGSCGFIQNVAFDPGVHEYSTSCEETQAFSPRFNEFARDLVRRLTAAYDLSGKTVLEIGCGKGDFLALLCEAAGCEGIGIDPGVIPERIEGPAAARIRFIQDFYSDKYSHLSGDFVCCRHTLEHIQPTRDFVSMVRRAVGDRPEAVVFFEVPDIHRVLEEQAFWDIYYEHCSYFSLGSLARLFRTCGFRVVDLYRGFDDQYLMIEARPGNPAESGRFEGEDDLESLGRAVGRYERALPEKVAHWKGVLGRCRDEGKRVVLWGSGSKAVGFLTTMGVGEELDYVVDINPHKHGKFMAGVTPEIVAPEFLERYRPDLVVVMNPVYREEIGAALRQMGLEPELRAV